MFFSLVSNNLRKTTNILFAISRRKNTTFGNNTMPDKLYKKVELEIRSSELAVLKSYGTFIKTVAEFLNLEINEIVYSRKPSLKRFTVLKSVHGHRKHLVQYEIRTHYSWLHFSKLTGSSADTVLEYVERMLPEGVALKVTRVSVEPMPDHLNLPSIKETSKRVETCL